MDTGIATASSTLRLRQSDPKNSGKEDVPLFEIGKKDINQGASDVIEFCLAKGEVETFFHELGKERKNSSTLKMYYESSYDSNYGSPGKQFVIFDVYLRILYALEAQKLPNLKSVELSFNEDQKIKDNILARISQALSHIVNRVSSQQYHESITFIINGNVYKPLLKDIT